MLRGYRVHHVICSTFKTIIRRYLKKKKKGNRVALRLEAKRQKGKHLFRP